MKLFKIELDNVGYDDYDSCVIVAESKEQVEELCECNFVKYEDWDINRVHPIILYDHRNVLSESFNIHNGQKWIITEVEGVKNDLSKEIKWKFIGEVDDYEIAKYMVEHDRCYAKKNDVDYWIDYEPFPR